MSIESSLSSGDIGPEKTKKSQNSSENERMNRDSINVVTTKISTALGTKFDQKDIPFDISTFKKNLNQSVEKVFSNPDIPDIAKEKFKQDILAKIDLLAQVTLGDIDILRTRRNIESVGMEAIEIKQKFGNDEAKIKAHYLGMILSETIGKYIQPTADGLMAAFSDKKESKGKNEYHGKTLETFSGSIQNLDTKYGLNMSAEIEKIANDFKRNTKGDISREDLYRQVGIKIVDALNAIKRIPDANRVKQFIMNGNLTERSKGGKLTEAQVPNGPKDIVDIVMEYKEAINTFQGTEREVRDARSTALSDSFGSKMKNAVGMEGLKSEFDHLKSTEIEQKMKNASLADFVIMGTQLAQIAPIVGDIGGGTLDIGSAITGISSDGAKLSKIERAFSGIFGTLGLTVFLGWISRASKAGKMAGIISGLRLGAKYLPDKIGEFLKSGGKLSEQTKTALSSFGKMMGQEASLKIEQMMLRNGGMVGFVEEGGENTKIGSTLSYADRVKKAEKRSEVSREVVYANASIPDTPEGFIKRIQVAESILKEKGLLPLNESLTDIQKTAIIEGHLAGGKGVYMNEVPDLMKKARASKELSVEQRRVLIENGIMDVARSAPRPLAPGEKLQKQFDKLINDANWKEVKKQINKAEEEAIKINKVVNKVYSETRISPQSIADTEIKKREIQSGIKSELFELKKGISKTDKSPEFIKTTSDAELALQEAGLLGKNEHLTMVQKKAIFDGHLAGKPIGEQDFGSIRDKARASNGIPKEWKKLLMDKGIMGVNEKLHLTTGKVTEKIIEKNGHLFYESYEGLYYLKDGVNIPHGKGKILYRSIDGKQTEDTGNFVHGILVSGERKIGNRTLKGEFDSPLGNNTLGILKNGSVIWPEARGNGVPGFNIIRGKVENHLLTERLNGEGALEIGTFGPVTAEYEAQKLIDGTRIHIVNQNERPTRVPKTVKDGVEVKNNTYYLKHNSSPTHTNDPMEPAIDLSKKGLPNTKDYSKFAEEIKENMNPLMDRLYLLHDFLKDQYRIASQHGGDIRTIRINEEILKDFFMKYHSFMNDPNEESTVTFLRNIQKFLNNDFDILLRNAPSNEHYEMLILIQRHMTDDLELIGQFIQKKLPEIENPVPNNGIEL